MSRAMAVWRMVFEGNSEVLVLLRMKQTGSPVDDGAVLFSGHSVLFIF